MDTKTQKVLSALEILRKALNAAGAQSQGGWMGKLFQDVESAHTRATSEAAIAQHAENIGKES